MKSWSYATVTEHAERQICSLIAEADDRPEEEGQHLREWAYGVYLMWECLTCGWREAGDDDKMRSLAERRK